MNVTVAPDVAICEWGRGRWAVSSLLASAESRSGLKILDDKGASDGKVSK